MLPQLFKVYILVLLLPLLLLQPAAFLSDGLLHVVFLNVGQGDAVLIRTAQNQNILIDGGPSNQVLRELGASLSFFDRQIDLLILTHPDSDHIFGLIEVIERYNIDRILLTGINKKSALYDEFLKNVRRRAIPIQIAAANSDIEIEPNLLLDILYPFENISGSSPAKANNTSIVARLIYGQNSILLTGDIEAEIEQKILQRYPDLKSNILKVAHHGSKTSSSIDFLNKLKPKIAVIQVGNVNQYGHPNAEIVERLLYNDAKILRNDFEGRIEIAMDSVNAPIFKRKSGLIQSLLSRYFYYKEP